ncbi:MAG TPA: hypothetical protein VMG60_23625 [Burkholderiaceae bacterium]|nr:hypothetical protein [Burkholderiaceae bacterium]
MSSRSVLLAACVAVRDPRVDPGALLDLWARDVSTPVTALGRGNGDACAAILDDLDDQPFLVAALRSTRAGLAVGIHLGTRVHGAGNDEPVVVSARSVDAARRLARAAADGQMLLSDDLGAFMTIARARLAPNLEATRVSLGAGPDTSAYRLRVAAVPPPTVRSTSAAPATIDESRRPRLIERLGEALTPFLGPIAPLMLQQLRPGRISGQELVDAVLRHVPAAQREPVKRLIEDEIRALR